MVLFLTVLVIFLILFVFLLFLAFLASILQLLDLLPNLLHLERVLVDLVPRLKLLLLDVDHGILHHLQKCLVLTRSERVVRLLRSVPWPLFPLSIVIRQLLDRLP